MKNKNVAIVGATGAVGREFIGCIESRGIPLASLKLLASARSAGKTQRFRGQELTVEELTEDSFNGVDIALFSAGSGISKQYAPHRGEGRRGGGGQFSSAFRMDPAVPLVVPEINARRITDHKGIIANPNCSAITTLVPLWPVHQVNPRAAADRLHLSGGVGRRRGADGGAGAFHPRLSGRQGLSRPRWCSILTPSISSATTPPSTWRPATTTKRPRSSRRPGRSSRMTGSRCRATCIRVPVLRAHSVSMTFECERPITPDEVRALLAKAPGVKLVDDWANNYFPMPKDASGQGDVLAGRIRKDLSRSVRQVDHHVRGGGSAVEGRGAERGADRGTALTTSSCPRKRASTSDMLLWMPAQRGHDEIISASASPSRRKRESSTALPWPWP